LPLFNEAPKQIKRKTEREKYDMVDQFIKPYVSLHAPIPGTFIITPKVKENSKISEE
jgi:hypothetical protein